MIFLVRYSWCFSLHRTHLALFRTVSFHSAYRVPRLVSI
jgi:hypothetical protein